MNSKKSRVTNNILGTESYGNFIRKQTGDRVLAEALPESALPWQVMGLLVTNPIGLRASGKTKRVSPIHGTYDGRGELRLLNAVF